MRLTSFEDHELSEDMFLDGKMRFVQPLKGYRAATDPVFLAAACGAKAGEKILDLGCGAGAAALCLGTRLKGVELHGLEVQSAYAELARKNASANDISLTVHEGDLRNMPESLRAMSFDHVITNPPFFAAESHSAAPDSGRDTAHRETVTLDIWLEAGLRRLKPGGYLHVIHRIERLPDTMAALAGKAGSLRVLPLQPREGRAAKRFILQARKGAKGPFELCAPMVLHKGVAHTGDHEDFTKEALAVLRHVAPIMI